MTDTTGPSMETLLAGIFSAVVQALTASSEDERTAHEVHVRVLVDKLQSAHDIEPADVVLMAMQPMAALIINAANRAGRDPRDLLPDFEAQFLHGSGDASS